MRMRGLRKRIFTMGVLAGAVFAVCLAAPVTSSAQDDRFDRIDKSKIAVTGKKTSDFVPADWKIEEEIKGDLNGDASADAVLAIQQVKAADGKEPARALIVLLAQANGDWKNVAVADRLLNCVGCGNAMEEINVTIKKGVLDVNQNWGNSGSSMGKSDYKFRLESASGRFRLIGADFTETMMPDKIYSESNNYLTGDRKTAKGKLSSDKDKTTLTKFSPKKLYLDDFNNNKLEEAAFTRLG